MSTITIGVDLAKSVFSVCAVDGAGHVQRRQDLVREAFALWLAQVPAGTVVAMEACNLRAVQLLLGHSKLESTVRYLGIEVDDALEMAEQTEA
ncbi:site-specific recombinase, phage integrase family protein [mine drainage metagenome]|uniref:Site-specific recombinase, phage integrase family protein n=2 Tax=mine drainage metagenome TaxID=410659 RepID=T0YF36_9ZZZZ